jgi:hypothetical protein
MLLRGECLVRDPDSGSPVDIPLSHTGHRVLPGHSLRFSVASSDFPLYLPHPGTEENPWFATAGQRNEQSLTTAASIASHLSLTVGTTRRDAEETLGARGAALTPEVST